MIRVGIFGVNGYAGYECLRWLRRHRQAEVVFTTSESQAGRQLGDIFAGPLDAPLIASDDAPLDAVDVVFVALPHGAAGLMARRARAAGVRVIDFSAYLRLATADEYRRWYGHEHPAPELLPAPYGIPELWRAQLRDAPVIANPGCYPTSVLLGLAPLLQQGLLAQPTIIIDAKSGVSGAGRAPKQNTHFVEVNESLAPYNVGRVHRHVGEMQQEAARLAAGTVTPEIIFSPHLMPISRGLLSTMYVAIPGELRIEMLHERYHAHYRDEPFLRVLPVGQLATIAHASHTNDCVISVALARPGMAIIIASIDNLVRGAAGQAIQNMNVMFGIDEHEGLR